jgi:sortase A
MSPEQERMLLLTPPDDLTDDPEHALARIDVGVSVLERGMARAETDGGPDDDLMMASLALSLERLARDAGPAAETNEQRQRLADAAQRIREVIDELAERERRRLRAVPTSAERPAPQPQPAAAPAPQPASEPVEDAHRSTHRAALGTAGIALLVVGLALGLFLLYEFAYTGQVEHRSQRALLSEFRQRLALTQFDAPDAPVQGGPAAILRIPSIGLNQVVVEGSSPSDLKQGPGHLPSSPLPGEFGNSVLLGHRLTYGGPFAKLDQLQKGDTIDVLTGQGHFTYTVQGSQIVKPGQPDVIGPAPDSRLTLITSTSAFGNDRRAITATLKGDPIAVPTRPPASAGADETGTSGDTAGLYLAVIWLIALAGVIYGAARAYRSWPRLAAHLVTTPLILMLLLLLYQNLDRFLPGTL